MDKPIPEAVIERAAAAFARHDHTQVEWERIPEDERDYYRRVALDMLTAAQQQGQAAPPSAPVGVEGVRRYLAARDAKPIRGMDPEVIHAIHTGTEWEAELRVSDLRAIAQQPAAVDEKYAELIYAVARKYPGESRHETALRYIRQAESADHGPAQAATQHQEPTT